MHTQTSEAERKILKNLENSKRKQYLTGDFFFLNDSGFLFCSFITYTFTFLFMRPKGSSSIFHMQKEKNCQPGILYPVKMYSSK